MIGGGPGSFIGPIHRSAACLDGRYELVAGCFSSDPKKSEQTGFELSIPKEKIYNRWQDLIDRESNQTLDVVSIVTPNHLHFSQAYAAIESGFHVICDKPMTYSIEEAKELVDVVQKSGKKFLLTHTYLGYPMVREARLRIQSGQFGAIRYVEVSYPQGWLNTLLENSGQKQALWRMDPRSSGKGGSLGDIGIHAFNLAEFVLNQEVVTISADVKTMVEGRQLDDFVTVDMVTSAGVNVKLFASQALAGEKNNISIKIYGEKGSLIWEHQHQSKLLMQFPDKPDEKLHAGVDIPYLHEHTRSSCRLPSGHPEGFIEAFANLYKDFADYLQTGDMKIPLPSEKDGLRGMIFIEKTIKSSDNSGAIEDISKL